MPGCIGRYWTLAKEAVVSAAMRHLIDTYIRAEESEKISAFDDLSLVTLLVNKGPEAVEELPEAIRKKEHAVAETIENNVRKVITEESPINPKYYERMSELLEALIEQRREGALEYQAYLAEITALAREVKEPSAATYPSGIDTPAKKSLYDNLNKDENLAVELDEDIRRNKPAGFRDTKPKLNVMRQIIRRHVSDDEEVERILEIVKAQREY